MQKPDINSLLESQETKNEIFKTIIDNNDYMMEFMESMQNSENAMQLFQGNKKMMGKMMKGKGMQMMMNDSTMIRGMMRQIMNDSTQMNSMMQMMHQKRMMSNECMQSCMQMMHQKRMMNPIK
jgi:transcriptional regulator of aromatic amino acid metabolism